MDGRRAAAWLYGTSAVVGPAMFWILGGADGRFVQYIALYELLPFGVLALALAATRSNSPAKPALELAAACLWCMTYLAVSMWYPLFNTIERMGVAAVDALATLTGLAAVGTL